MFLLAWSVFFVAWEAKLMPTDLKDSLKGENKICHLIFIFEVAMYLFNSSVDFIAGHSMVT